MRGLLLSVLMLSGCSPVRQLNEGAALPIYAIDRMELQHKFPKLKYPNGVTQYNKDGEVIAIWLSPLTLDSDTVAIVLHEFGHVIERRYPQVWDALTLFESDQFVVTRHAKRK